MLDLAQIAHTAERLAMRALERLRLVVGRVVLDQVDDTTKVQRVQFRGLAGEVRARVEHFAQYGFTSKPKAGAEGIALFPGGDRGNGILIAVEDRRYRLTSLADGEVALYDDLGQRVHLKRTGVEVVSAGDLIADVAGAASITAAMVEIDSDVHVTGNMFVDGEIDDASGIATSMQAMRAAYNLHKHSNPEGGLVGPPTEQM